MCTQCMEWDLLYVLQISKPQTLQKLATMAHDMDVTIANYHNNSFRFAESKRDSAKFKRNVEFSDSQ